LFLAQTQAEPTPNSLAGADLQSVPEKKSINKFDVGTGCKPAPAAPKTNINLNKQIHYEKKLQISNTIFDSFTVNYSPNH
jgi:hypothetical protein